MNILENNDPILRLGPWPEILKFGGD